MELHMKMPDLDRAATVDDLPKPTGYFVMIHIPEMEEVTSGGIHLTTDLRKREQYASPMGHVVEIGPVAYKSEERFPTGPWCAVGDCIIIKPYAGRAFWVRVEDKLNEFRIIADDEVMAVVPRPDLIVRRD